MGDLSAAPSNKSLGQINRQFWNDNMHIISQQQWVRDLAKQLVRNLQDNLDWVGVPKSTETSLKTKLSLLDYACGTGLITFALLPWFSKIRGIDISDANVQRYNQLARDQGVSPDVVRAIQGDIRSPDSEMSTEDFSGFNAIVISMALHHIDDPKSLLSHLYGRLRPGGHLLVVDWTPEHYGIEGSVANHAAVHTTGVDDFDKAAIVEMMSSAGLQDVGFFLAPERSSMGKEIGGERQMFFARGKRLD
ncbi:S-adenosyl-L-methionine-dependent methyltransferase [Fusarium tricinctum]|uniref:S-adenosyl-L-methionine-dependent methyltransferase n=1 Tax=Fusarium tricinctum TaxID=61284 RepID=A0A8K0WD98_9HYPO|nr:S-adenosyl-L-methionine-dependent methyltransferase [Fusarium tricinctum]